MEKKEAAKLMYNDGALQKEIAEILHIQPKTVGAWVKEGKWEEKRTQHALAKDTAEEKVWKLINFNLRVLEMMSDKQEKLLDPSMNIEELKKLLTPRGDIDALQKLFTTIKGKELEWTKIVKIIREFTEFVQESDIIVAKQLVNHANLFLNDKRQDQQ